MIRTSLTVSAVCLVLVFAAVAANTDPGILISSDWLAVHLHDRNVVVLHVGIDRRSYDAGHIPGARFLAINDIVVTKNGVPNQLPPAADLQTVFRRLGLDDSSRVVLYGDHIGLLAARAFFTLDYLGHGKTAALLDGGLEKWRTEKRELSTGQPGATDVAAATFTAKPHPEVLIELPALRQLVAENRTPLIDARPPDEFYGRRPGEGIRQGGHIPGAKNVFWVENLMSPENPVLKPAAEIRAKYEAAGVKPGDKVVVYCRTGVQASHDYFTLKLLGFNPVLYNGSFLEWGNTFGTPIER